MYIPEIEEIDRIAANKDPVVRNLQITYCYHQLSAVMASRCGPVANWCTFATWASKQAGQTIRKEDLRRSLQATLNSSPETVQAAQSINASLSKPERSKPGPQGDPAQLEGIFTHAVDIASEAVGRGNLKVFEEIGREFARFFSVCLGDETPQADNLERFCQGLRLGEPPEGQTYLQKAFSHYYRAFFEPDPKARAELILLANIEIGFHEQTRLQPEIAAGLDAGLSSGLEFTRKLLARAFPFGGFLALSRLYVMRLLGRPTTLDLAVQTLVAAARVHMRHLLTESVLTIQLPDRPRLRLGVDLGASFPENLRAITNPELQILLATFDPTPDSPSESGALDWANLSERLHFIIDMFRSFQEIQALLTAPFTPEQIAEIQAGRLPPGEL